MTEIIYLDLNLKRSYIVSGLIIDLGVRIAGKQFNFHSIIQIIEVLFP